MICIKEKKSRVDNNKDIIKTKKQVYLNKLLLAGEAVDWFDTKKLKIKDRKIPAFKKKLLIRAWFFSFVNKKLVKK